ncbi:MAG: OsmC family protein [Anaerolineaceae bacterium]|nr:OsmC family protein [Anaerolineaceae bacterium]
MKSAYASAKSTKGFKVEVQARNHLMVIDQPLSLGGENSGPSPLEYLFASLGSCLVTVGLIIARQEHLEVNEIIVDVEGELDLDVLMGKSVATRSGFQGITAKYTIDAPSMSASEKQVFVNKIEMRCPISDNLANLTPLHVIVN